MVSYYTPRPPVFEVEEFPRFPNKQSIDAFLAWSGFESAKKEYRKKEWRLHSVGYNSSEFATPGYPFIRPAGEPDKFHPARRWHPYERELLQEIYGKFSEYELKVREDY